MAGRRHRSRSQRPILAFAVLALVAVGIGALWALAQPAEVRHRDDIEAELQALRESEARRAAKPSAKRTTTPPLCRQITTSTRGRVGDAGLNELSGLVASRREPGLFWAIEDSGAEPVVSALRENGTPVGSWTVAGAANTDWEDVASGPGPSGPVLYAADIGDNLEKRDAVTVYRVAEPAAPAGGGTTAPADRLELTYPDGAHDAEALVVDPRRGTLLIFTKGLPGSVYALSPPLPFGSAGKARLKLVGPAPLSLATAADVSADGSTVALRGYLGYVIWQRRGNEPLTQTVKREPCSPTRALTDGQGEAIALSKGGSTAWTVAEGERPPILRHRETK